MDWDSTPIESPKKIIAAYAQEYFPSAQLDLYEDRNRSGYMFVLREGLQQIRPRLLSGEYSILIVKDFSCFSRQNNSVLAEPETSRDAGVHIISIGDGIYYPIKDGWILIQFKFN